MARYPISVNIKRTPLKAAVAVKAAVKMKPVAAAKPTKAATQSVLRRAERIQAEEAGESALMKRKTVRKK